jgi:hypothetical protein
MPSVGESSTQLVPENVLSNAKKLHTVAAVIVEALLEAITTRPGVASVTAMMNQRPAIRSYLTLGVKMDAPFRTDAKNAFVVTLSTPSATPLAFEKLRMRPFAAKMNCAGPAPPLGSGGSEPSSPRLAPVKFCATATGAASSSKTGTTAAAMLAARRASWPNARVTKNPGLLTTGSSTASIEAAAISCPVVCRTAGALPTVSPGSCASAGAEAIAACRALALCASACDCAEVLADPPAVTATSAAASNSPQRLQESDMDSTRKQSAARASGCPALAQAVPAEAGRLGRRVWAKNAQLARFRSLQNCERARKSVSFTRAMDGIVPGARVPKCQSA